MKPTTVLDTYEINLSIRVTERAKEDGIPKYVRAFLRSLSAIPTLRRANSTGPGEGLANEAGYRNWGLHPNAIAIGLNLTKFRNRTIRSRSTGGMLTRGSLLDLGVPPGFTRAGLVPKTLMKKAVLLFHPGRVRKESADSTNIRNWVVAANPEGSTALPFDEDIM